MVIWVVGPSGVGKSTLAQAIQARWRQRGEAAVLVDGDELREVFEVDRSASDYSLASRRENAERLAALTAWLDGQGVHVVAAVMLLFDDISDRLRDRCSSYFQVGLDVPFDVLEERDPKGLYEAARSGEMSNVVGVDLPWTPRTNSDVVFDNTGNEPDWEDLADDILDLAESAA